MGVTCVVNAACELPDTPLPNDREVAYYKVDVADRATADLLSHMDFVADMIEEVGSEHAQSTRYPTVEVETLDSPFTFTKLSDRPTPRYVTQIVRIHRVVPRKNGTKHSLRLYGASSLPIKFLPSQKFMKQIL
jgi:hypothetical protein